MRPRIGLALAGGGPLGAIDEIGALCALEAALTGIDFADCHSDIGVSAGGFIAAGLANGMRPRRVLAEHACQRTRRMMRSRRGSLNRQLARHGVQFDDAVLDDASRRLLQPAKTNGRITWLALRRLEEVLDALETTLRAWPQQQLQPAPVPR